MSIDRVTFLTCDEPGCDGEFNAGWQSIRDVGAAARTDGWTWSPQRGDRCPTHARWTS